jgi:hypothetical protein
MNSKSKYTLISFFCLILIFVIQIIYLQNTNQISKKTIADKNRFVAITNLTDLAFYSNDPYIRHRSLSNRADLFRYDNKLLPFSKGTFSYSSCKIPAL